MALNFPSSPTIGQIYTDSVSGFSYEWNGTVWISFTGASSSQIKPLDDISGSFDDVTQTFALTSNSVSITPPTAQSLIINLGGVIQDATDDYSVTSSNITFSTPPTSGLSFSGVSLGPAIPINTIPDGTVTDGSLRISTTAVVGSATTFTEDLVVSGDARITGILTVGTGSITLNGSTNTISGITTINTTSINGGPLAGMRNAIINGNFDIWQRGTSFTGSVYGPDRWFHSRVGTTHTVTQQAFTLGQTDVPGEPTYYCRTVVSSVAGAGNAALLVHKVENVRTFAGQQVTVGFWAKADATKNIAVDLAQDFGTGGSPSARVTDIGVTKISIGTNWQKVTVTATLPSISGKTLGTDNNDYLQFDIWFDAGSNFNARTDTLGQQSGTFEIAQVQVEPGPVATPFERRPIGTELALCQRYFEKSYSISIVPGTASSGPGVFGTRCSSSNELGTISFKQSKRVNPSIILYNWSTGATGTWRDGSGATDKTVTAGSIGESSFAFDVTSSVDGNQILGHWTASAEL